jgi:hypothetical protein
VPGERHLPAATEDAQPDVRAGAFGGEEEMASEKFVSRVIAAIVSAVRLAVSRKTASWLPVNGRSVNTSYWR